MRNKIQLAVLAFLFTVSTVSAQSLNLIDTLNFPGVNNIFGDVGGSDCWGWTDPNGVDYAIMGTYYGTAYVRASDRLVCDQVAGPQDSDPYYHRDIKTYRNYAYLVAEMGGTNEGVQIIDLSPLPDSVRVVGSYVYNLSNVGPQVTSHNINIDTAKGFAYVLESGASGARMIDLSNPEVPVDAGFLPVANIHDIFVRNDTAWVAEGWSYGYSVWDLSDKNNPVLILRITDPGFGYAHNIWPSDDGRYFITTEETANKTVKIWDASNPGNVQMLGQYLAPCNLAHNVHVMGDYIFISHYESGVTVVNFADPNNPVEVAAYDTYPQSDNADFLGCWGAFPFTQDKWVYASNFDGTLFFLKWDSTTTAQAEVTPEATSELSAAPNPFVGDEQLLKFRLAERGEVEVAVYSLDGKRVRNLFEGNLSPGSHALNWNGKNDAGVDLPAGLYKVVLHGATINVSLSVIIAK